MKKHAHLKIILHQVACGGISAAVFGKWTMKVGTRAALVVGGSIYGSAWVITGIGVATHTLPLVYLGNGELTFLQGHTLLPPFKVLFCYCSSLGWSGLRVCLYPSYPSSSRMVSRQTRSCVWHRHFWVWKWSFVLRSNHELFYQNFLHPSHILGQPTRDNNRGWKTIR